MISSEFYYEIQPVSKPRQSQSDRWKKRPCVVRYRDYADEMRAAAGFQDFYLGERCAMIFELEMPKSWSKKKKNLMRGKPHQQKPDLDNLIKSCGDLFLADDSGIHAVFAAKFWGDQGSVRIVNVMQDANYSIEDLLRLIRSSSMI
jgi:Holliday junction resolvase RusA-like endonuclease